MDGSAAFKYKNGQRRQNGPHYRCWKINIQHPGGFQNSSPCQEVHLQMGLSGILRIWPGRSPQTFTPGVSVAAFKHFGL